MESGATNASSISPLFGRIGILEIAFFLISEDVYANTLHNS